MDTPVRVEQAFGNPPSDEILRNPGDPQKLARFLGALGWILRPTIVFEDGAEDGMQEHKSQGGNFILVMSHFRRLGPGHLGAATQKHDALADLPDTTGVTARRELAGWPIIGPLVSSAQIEWVERPPIKKGEPEAQKAQRHAQNMESVERGARYVASGGNWIMWPEGNTKVKVTKPDGTIKRVARDPGVLLPIQDGIGTLLGLLTPEQRRNVRLLGIAEHFGPRLLRSLRPTLAFTTPEAPVEGGPDDWKIQTHDILQRGVDIAMHHDYARRRR